MRKRILLAFLFFDIMLFSFNTMAAAVDNEDTSTADRSIKQDLLCVYMAYHDYIEDFEKDSSSKIYIKFKTGNKVIYDDKAEKSFDQQLINGDVEDSLKQLYSLEPVTKLSDENFDPGRVRSYGLLGEVYGRNKAEMEKNVVNVPTKYRNYMFNKNNGAADALKSIMNELSSYPNQNFSRFLFPGSGTYNYRYVRGTGRLSAHAFGIAMDINTDKRDYWKWCSKEQGEKRILEYPKEMVQLFEKNNFIWGGKWGHFDTMHFEYRPEIILKARYFSTENTEDKNWYGDLDQKNEIIKQGISKIDNAL